MLHSAIRSSSSASRLDGVANLPNRSLPSFWTAPSQYSAESTAPTPPRRTRIKALFKGWRLILLGSWLNLLLVLIPISWALDLTMPNSHTLRFIFCILALIPLVKLHDLSTHELALRIGGSKTGLINASLSNVVSIVVAISALRRCELTLVQSSLMGSILSRLLLVLGLCFFAGGTRFSEQVFDPTATQVHSSLLSISVGALFLPAAYHFSLSGEATDIPGWQKDNILRMSHGVSIVLLLIYIAYLVFQLWSHSYLYHDRHNMKSRGFFRREPKESPGTSQDGKQREQPIYTTLALNDYSRSVNEVPLPPKRSHMRPLYLSPTTSCYSSPSSSQLSLALPALNPATTSQTTLTEPTVRLVYGGYPMGRNSTASGYSNSASTKVGRESQESNEKSGEALADTNLNLSGDEEEPVRLQDVPPKPRMSWPLAIFLLVLVTVTASLTADWLVESMDGISATISKEWVGFILLPAVTAIAECMTAVNVSVKDQLTLSISVAVGSSIQTALFVIPFIVSLAWAMGKPLSLLMDPFQSLVLYISVQTMNYVVADGKSNWLEGLILICLYVIIAVSFWFYPGSNLPTSLATCIVSD